MSYRKTPTGNAPKTPQTAGGRRAEGFTLIEMVVAIVVLGILSAAVGVNWSSFMQHQRLRQDALSLHKEILALKARAIEQDTAAQIEYASNGTSYSIVTFVLQSDADVPPVRTTRTVALNSNITIETSNIAVNGELPDDSKFGPTNHWAKNATSIEIVVKPNGLDAYDNGRIVIKSRSGKPAGQFCIQKDSTGIKPEIYYRSNGNNGTTWKKS